MLGSIIASGLAVGAVYALIGVTYNTMFSASRVISFTAGQLGMLGGVFGSLFVLRLGLPLVVGLVLTLVCCAIVGLITELVAVRPVLKSSRSASVCALNACTRADDFSKWWRLNGARSRKRFRAYSASVAEAFWTRSSGYLCSPAR